MVTFKQVDGERRILRGVIAKGYEDLVVQANLATEVRVVRNLWELAGRLESVMRKFGIERETETRRNP